MGWLDRFKRKGKKVVVIGLDGTPYSLVSRLVAEGKMPHFADLLKEGTMRPMNSVLPTVSSVAWSSFMTGKNPGKHGIYGFIDRVPDSYKTYIPTSKNMQSETLWEILSRHGRRVVVINVPVTYPPRKVNGIVVAGFLSPSLGKATYPPSVAQELREMGYIIDVDPWRARESKDQLLEDLDRALEKRAEAMFRFMDREPWDFLICHIMETDRLHHFLWEQMEKGDEKYGPAFFAFYRKIDDVLGQVAERLDEDTTLIVMSDHGFCTLKREVNVNYWLRERGYLRFRKEPPETSASSVEPSLADIHPDSVAYSLIPGRIYVNLRGREPRGCVEPGRSYLEVRERLAGELLEMRDPDTGERMVERVMKREEVYSGPCYEQAPDLVVVPLRGYDLKGGLKKESLTCNGVIVGMHTYDDAMLYVTGGVLARENLEVIDVMPMILNLMDVHMPDDVDGVITD